jgi:predicted DNA-binding transcriptional regulator AlpA
LLTPRRKHRRGSLLVWKMKSTKKTAAASKETGTPAAIIERNHAYRIKAALTADAKRSGVKAHRAHRPRGPPDLASIHERLAHRVGLLDKREICLITGVSFPTVWKWMCANKFPRARTVGGTSSKSKWSAAEIADWLNELPPRALKGDGVAA